MKAIIILCLLSMAMFSCKKEGTGRSITLIENQSSHDIELLPYLNGKQNADIKKFIPKNSTKEVQTAGGRDKEIGSSYGITLQPYDSVVVIFDGLVKRVHLKFNSSANTTGKIVFSDKRSIINNLNYKLTIVQEQ
jgi:hypothetical protein